MNQGRRFGGVGFFDLYLADDGDYRVFGRYFFMREVCVRGDF